MNTQGSQLAADKYSNVNKHNAPHLTEKNFPNLPQLSLSFNWHNHRQLNPATLHLGKIDQSQHPAQSRRRNDVNSLELIKK
jgi:hypothetical protein